MKIIIDIHSLRDILSYDTEELQFLDFYERCEIQRNISKLINYKPTDFSKSLKEKIIQKLVEIKQISWERPEIKIYMEEGELKRTRLFSN